MGNFHPLEVVGRGEGTQLQVGGKINYLTKRFNPLSPHDALKHHFESIKTNIIFRQQRVLERKFP